MMNFKLWGSKPPKSIRKILHDLRKNPVPRFVIPDKTKD